MFGRFLHCKVTFLLYPFMLFFGRKSLCHYALTTLKGEEQFRLYLGGGHSQRPHLLASWQRDFGALSHEKETLLESSLVIATVRARAPPGLGSRGPSSVDFRKAGILVPRRALIASKLFISPLGLEYYELWKSAVSIKKITRIFGFVFYCIPLFPGCK